MKMVTSSNNSLARLPYKRLLRTFEPEIDENYPGYLLRLVEANGYDTITWITNLAGLPDLVRSSIPRLREGTFDFGALATLAGASLEKLQRLPFPLVSQLDGSQQYVFPAGLLPYHFIPARPYKICPLCLMEAAYLRRVWDLLPITACIRHACILIDRCEGCGKLLPWSRRKVCCCPCGYDWRHSAVVAVQEREMDITRHFAGIIGMAPSIGARLNNERLNPLFDCSPSEFLTSLSLIICHWEPDARRLGLREARKFSNAQLHQFLCQAIAVFDQWPQNLYQFLNDHAKKMEKKLAGRNLGLVRQFPLFVDLDRSSLHRSLRLLRGGFEEFVKTQWSGTHLLARKRVVGHLKKNSRYVSFQWAEEKLRTYNGLNYLIKMGKIRRVERMTPAGRKMLLLERADVLTLEVELKKFLVCWKVSKKLGLPLQAQVLELASGGLLQRQYPFGKERRYYFLETEVNSLLATLDACVTTSSEDPKEIWTFRKFRKHQGHYGLNLADMLRSVLSGELSIHSKSSGVGLQSYRFSAKKAKDWLISQRIAKDRAACAVSVGEARSRLGITASTISWLIKQKLLLVQRRACSGRPASIVKESDLAAFQQIYTSAWHLAASVRRSPSKIIQALRLHNILPVVSPPSELMTDRAFFRRSDLIGVDLAGIVQAPPLSKKAVEKQQL